MQQFLVSAGGVELAVQILLIADSYLSQINK